MRPVPYFVLAFAMAVPAVLIGVEIPSWYFVGSRKLALQSDLRVFYTPAYMLRTGQRKDLYDFAAIRRNQEQRVAADNGAVPFLHPAYEVLAFLPLSFLSYRTAYLAWAGINFAVLGMVHWSIRPCLRDLSAIGPAWMPPALLLGFMPVAFTILAGQDSLLLLLILVAAYRCIETNQLQAGVVLGLGMFRFQVLLPIVVLFLFWRGLKFVGGWVAGSAIVLSVSALLTGVAAQVQYAKLLRGMSAVSLWLLLRRMPNLRGLFAAWHLSIVLLGLVSVLIFVGTMLIGARQDVRRKLLLAISASALVTYYFFLHDLSILALPLLVLMNEAVARRDWLRAGMVAAALLAYAILWFARDSFYLGAIFTSFFLAVQFTSTRREDALDGPEEASPIPQTAA